MEVNPSGSCGTAADHTLQMPSPQIFIDLNALIDQDQLKAVSFLLGAANLLFQISRTLFNSKSIILNYILATKAA